MDPAQVFVAIKHVTQVRMGRKKLIMLKFKGFRPLHKISFHQLCNFAYYI